jgi:hypothetical protein
MDTKLARYKKLLKELQCFLELYAETKWANRLRQWVSELDGLTLDGGTAHLRRTQKALGGMGSIGDIVICPENGHSILNEEVQVNDANERLRKFISDLFVEIEKLH